MPIVQEPPDAKMLVDETRIGLEDSWVMLELQTESGAVHGFRMHPKQAHAFSDQLLQAVAESMRRRGVVAEMPEGKVKP